MTADPMISVVPAKAGTSRGKSMFAGAPAFAGATILAALLLTACGDRPELPAGSAPLDPIAFFTGPTNGTGTLDTIVARPVPVTVASRGLRERNSLKLVQRISEGDKPTRVRIWTMKPVGRGRYVGTLTDAVGKVSIAVAGPRATIDYATPSGLHIRQQLALQADGRTILNRLTAHRFGIRVATLNETIRR